MSTAWLGLHIYHVRRDLVLTDLVRPAVAALLREGRVRRFFCVRYDLGGPHVRLRLEVDDAAAVAAQVRDEAARFFARHPSRRSITDDEVHRRNAAIIAGDPFAGESDDRVVPDSSVAEAPVHFEVERYGGDALFGHTRDFFVLSTVEALRFLDAFGPLAAGARLAHAARLLVRQAWGYAKGAEEFTRLVGYAAAQPGTMAGFAAEGESAFQRRREALCTLLRAELAAQAKDAPPPLAEGAAALGHALREAGDEQRWITGGSQLHMTANRVGLANPEEVYLCRLLELAARTLADDGEWAAVWDDHGRRAAPRPLGEQVDRALAAEMLPAPLR